MIDKPEPLKSGPSSQSKVDFWQTAESLAKLRKAEHIALIRTGLPMATIQMAAAALNVNRHVLWSGLNLLRKDGQSAPEGQDILHF